MNTLRFNLNGTWVEESTVPPTTTLLRYLRDVRRMSGTKEGCAEGDCGACTVAVAEFGPDGRATWRAVNSCLVLLPMLQGKHVVTVEALKDTEEDAYHPAQVAMAKALGSQCGYCTPGIVMAMFEATYRDDLKAPWQLDDQLCGNLCRCTGYRPIREAASTIAGCRPDDRFALTLPTLKPQSMRFRREGDGVLFATPTTFDELWGLLETHPDARFVVGGTDLSLEITKRFQVPPKLISLEGLHELHTLRTGPVHHLGCAVTIAELEAWAEAHLKPLHRMVRYFGARQIKHRGTIGGNLCTASPIGDLAPALIGLGAAAMLRSRVGERRVPLEAFFVGYRKTALQPGEILAAVEVPALSATTRAASYKVSKRRELDISAVSAGLLVEVDAKNVVTAARLAFGGMAATPKRASHAEAALLGNPWTEATVENAANALAQDFTPLSDHRGSAPYRSLVAANLLRGFFDETRDVPQPVLAPGHAATVLTAEEVRHG
ncbi:MAG: xanthine dehydrogenase small subunit [Myxococcaceae bacterium]|nr:xanthine dehydrogenase small subunit [Myxococcaceae bacterium]